MTTLWRRLFGRTTSAPISERDLEPLYAEAEKLRAPFVGLVPELGHAFSRPEQSRLGGRPFWPSDEPYPASAKSIMVFLAQINFADMPELEDFPTQGLVLGRSGIEQAYRTGKGRIIVRARTTTEEFKGDREAIKHASAEAVLQMALDAIQHNG